MARTWGGIFSITRTWGGIFSITRTWGGVVDVFVASAPGVPTEWDFSDPANSQVFWLLWDELILWG